MSLSRRRFLAASAALAAGGFANAIDPIKRPGAKPDLKLSLAAYSMRQFLDLKKPTMTLFEFIDFAAELPLDAVELTSYFWAETTDAYAEKLKAHAAKKKLAISGVPVGNNFCLKDEAKYKAEIQKVKDWTERAAKVGREDRPHLRGQPREGRHARSGAEARGRGHRGVLRGRGEARRGAGDGEPRRHHRDPGATARAGQAGEERGAWA